MFLTSLTFENGLYLFFSCSTFINILFVLYSYNIIHSILYLVLVFFNISALLILIGSDFFATIFLVVYAGAIAMLFIFVFMMLNIKKLNKNLARFHPNFQLAFFLGFLLCWQFFFIFSKIFFIPTAYLSKMTILGYFDLFFQMQFFANLVKGLGLLFYTKYSVIFLLAGLLLLLGMVVTILLILDNYFFYSFFFFGKRQLFYKSKKQEYLPLLKNLVL